MNAKSFPIAVQLAAMLPAQDEKTLHKQIAMVLKHKGIWFVHSRTDKRTTQAKGVPDFLFAITDYACRIRHACAWEIKHGKGKLRPEQANAFHNMAVLPNAWRCRVIRSVAEAVEELKELGL